MGIRRDMMNVITLLEVCAKKDIKLWTLDGQLRYKSPVGALDDTLKQKIIEMKQEIIDFLEGENSTEISHRPAEKFQDFPLTDIQLAYLVGRNKGYQYGGVGCKVYAEFLTDIVDGERFTEAVKALVNRHEMLKAKIYKEGQQHIQETMTNCPVLIQDLTNLTASDQNSRMADVRKTLQFKQYEPSTDHLFDFVLCILNDKEGVLHFSLDMLIGDFVSIDILMNDLIAIYKGEKLEELTITFRDYICYKTEQSENTSYRQQYQKAKDYWMSRIDQLPAAPELPLEIRKEIVDEGAFSKIEYMIPSDAWQKIEEQAKKYRITTSMVILAAYGLVLQNWSRDKNFLMNVTTLSRPDAHPQLNSIVGDFTTNNLLEISIDGQKGFRENTTKLQLQLFNDLQHNLFSGVEVLRELNRKQDDPVIVPYVFTSTIGVDTTHSALSKMALKYKISQTPQVILDCQVSQQQAGVLVNWDIREGVYPPHMIEDMFTTFKEILNRLIINDDQWNKPFLIDLPKEMQAVRNQVNDTSKDVMATDMFQGIYEAVRRYEEKLAVVDNNQRITYGVLGQHIGYLQSQLKSQNIKRDDRIGICLGKGLWQVAAAIAIVSVGGVYVPIDISQPLDRQQSIMDQCGMKAIVVSSSKAEVYSDLGLQTINTCNFEETKGYQIQSYGRIDPKDRAYIIFTSGSTGVPKGVEMCHDAAMNTIIDINDKFNVDYSDVVLGVSNLYFDLSVYDIFGVLAVGGTLVLPTENRKSDVSHWAKLVAENNVTIMNMVPAQMDMYVTYVEVNPTIYSDTIRLALLSGDWISPKLVQRINVLNPQMECISLGGATEGGIWSIYYDTKELSPNDKSVPYGKPLTNQHFYILDDYNNHCPDWVPGEICIGGRSLANGYFNDEILSQEKFFMHPKLKEIIYRTGDLGRYRNDGIIEFLGRKDTQVKVNGYRIELGEIESALKNHEQISNAVVLKNENNKLVAYVEPLVETSKSKEQVKISFEESKVLKIPFSREDLATWMDLADKTAVGYIYKTFYEANLFSEVEKLYRLEDISNTLAVLPTYNQLLKRWLSALTKHDFIRQDEEVYYVKRPYEEGLAESIEKAWYEADERIGYSDVLLEYIHQSSIALKDILSGALSPHSLLFPQGSFEIAYAAYKDNVLNHYLNQVVQEKVLNLLKEKALVDRPFKILEVGAGVGGTSIDLIKGLQGQNVSYCFTDVSNFFLNEGRTQFKQYPWVDFKLFDIDQNGDEQGFESNSYDVILCANVLHNAKEIATTLKNLSALLVPDGQLMILEAVKERHALMTSVEFEFARSEQGYQDNRDSSETIFIGYEDWEKHVQLVGGHMSFAYPREEDILSPGGQMMMIATFDQHKVVDENKVMDYLASKLPHYMVPSQVAIMDQFPLTANGKVDRKSLLKEAKVDAQLLIEEERDISPLNDLEKRIHDIWCEVVGKEQIRKIDDFYAIGGDSLLIAQVTTKMMNRLPETDTWEWDRLMMTIMKNATIEKIASELSTLEEETPIDATDYMSDLSSLICFKEATEEPMERIVLFHTGTGTLSAYKEMLPYLVETLRPNQGLYGFNFGDVDSYLARPTETLIADLGRKYADVLMENSTDSYVLLGYCVGGWIALETAKILVENGVDVAKVKVISTSLSGHSFDNELLLERAFGLSIGANIEKAGYIGDNQLLQKALSEIQLLKDSGGISTEELSALTGTYRDIGKGFKILSEKTQEDRLKAIYESVSEVAVDSEYGNDMQMFELLYKLFRNTFKGVMQYTPSVYVGDVQGLFVEDDTKHFFPVKDVSNKELWESIVLGNIDIDFIPGEHATCIEEPYVKEVATQLNGLKDME